VQKLAQSWPELQTELLRSQVLWQVGALDLSSLLLHAVAKTPARASRERARNFRVI